MTGSLQGYNTVSVPALCDVMREMMCDGSTAVYNIASSTFALRVQL